MPQYDLRHTPVFCVIEIKTFCNSWRLCLWVWTAPWVPQAVSTVSPGVASGLGILESTGSSLWEADRIFISPCDMWQAPPCNLPCELQFWQGPPKRPPFLGCGDKAITQEVLRDLGRSWLGASVSWHGGAWGVSVSPSYIESGAYPGHRGFSWGFSVAFMYPSSSHCPAGGYGYGHDPTYTPSRLPSVGHSLSSHPCSTAQESSKTMPGGHCSPNYHTSCITLYL